MEDIFRRIKKVITGKSAVDGAGVKLVRVFGYDDTQEFDPFLMLDAFDSVDSKDYIKGFPWHPHRGIETITYLIDGMIEHGDSLGNSGNILEGECQWMTSGSGIIHQEMPKPAKRMLGVQLWLNMPAKDKMAEPKYNGILKTDIPVIEEDKVKIHIIAGVYKEVVGAFQGDYVKPIYLDVEMEPGAVFEWDIKEEDTAFAYVLQGSGFFHPFHKEVMTEKHLMLFGEGNKIHVEAADHGLRFLVLAGKPLKESIAWGGPIVMNTREELERAFKELDENTFIKH